MTKAKAQVLTAVAAVMRMLVRNAAPMPPRLTCLAMPRCLSCAPVAMPPPRPPLSLAAAAKRLRFRRRGLPSSSSERLGAMILWGSAAPPPQQHWRPMSLPRLLLHALTFLRPPAHR